MKMLTKVGRRALLFQNLFSWLQKKNYTNGRDVEQSDTEAIKWYRISAGQGEVQAQINLGIMYHDGEGVAQSYEALQFVSAELKGDPEVLAAARPSAVAAVKQQGAYALQSMPEELKNDRELKLANARRSAPAQHEPHLFDCGARETPDRRARRQQVVREVGLK